MKNKARVLVVDDEAFVLESLEALLLAEGYLVTTASGAEQAAEILRGGGIDVVLTDMRMPKGDGNSLIAAARSEGIEVPVLVLTGASSVSEAVTAMKAGAYDLLEKPAHPDRLKGAVERALERGRLQREVRGLRASLLLPREGRSWVAHSPAAQRVQAALQKAACSAAPVLLTGPSGVGKGVVAEELHRASDRARQPFVRVDCAALSAELAALVLFGRGRIQGGPEALSESQGRVALAEGGSLFLDEVGCLPREAQGRLLNLIEHGEYTRVGEQHSRGLNVRVIATTNQQLRLEVERGNFREDLYWRLEVLRIDVPTLALRREDLGALTLELGRSLIQQEARRGVTFELDPNALALMEAYSWPGNVRELRSVLERALLLSEASSESDASAIRLSADTISGALDSHLTKERDRSKAGADEDLSLRLKLLALERRLVLEAIKRTQGKRKEAADLLGVDSRNLGYYFRKHRITAEELERAERG